MIAVGFAGGLVPSPSAVVVLLGGIALGRAWFGALLVVSYGIGMALALIGAGLALAKSRDHIARWARRHQGEGRKPGLLLRASSVLPGVAATLVMLGGATILVRGALML